MIKTTIVAPATALVAQPIGIIRLSGPESLAIAQKITKRNDIEVRRAHCVQIHDKVVLDHAVLIYFQSPASFTGEDVVELQMHGNPHMMEKVIALCIAQGAVMAQPGEFSKRAFTNGKMSLDQVEAVADLIHATSLKAAKSAALSLDGALSQAVARLQSELMALRVLVEASIDFSEEDIPTISEEKIRMSLAKIDQTLAQLLIDAKRGASLQQGLRVVLAGSPNAGKSTLMNAVCRQDVSIVTKEEGTTRDMVSREVIHKGVALQFSDTAGLRDTDSEAEKFGIERSYKAIDEADLVLHVSDATSPSSLLSRPSGDVPMWKVLNKIDCLSITPSNTSTQFYISAKQHTGVGHLLDAIVEHFKLGDHTEAPFSARMRQVEILHRAYAAHTTLQSSMPEEILAQGLLSVQQILSEITGEVTTDDVLGELFAGFCIGK